LEALDSAVSSLDGVENLKDQVACITPFEVEDYVVEIGR